MLINVFLLVIIIKVNQAYVREKAMYTDAHTPITERRKQVAKDNKPSIFNDFPTFVKAPNGLLFVAAICAAVFVGSYGATHYGFTEEQQKDIELLKKAKTFQAALNGDHSAQAAIANASAPAAPVAPVVMPTLPTPAPVQQREKGDLLANAEAVSEDQKQEYREKVLRYTTSEQEQMKITCDSAEDGHVSWQAGVERYTVNGEVMLVNKLHSEYTVLQDYKAAGYKCDYRYTANIFSLEDSVKLLSELSDGYPHSVKEFGEAAATEEKEGK